MQHSLWRDMIVANSESATDMERSHASTPEYYAVQRTAIATYVHAHALQVRASCAQRWRCGSSPPRPAPTPPAALQPPNLVKVLERVLNLRRLSSSMCASLSAPHLREGTHWDVRKLGFARGKRLVSV